MIWLERLWGQISDHIIAKRLYILKNLLSFERGNDGCQKQEIRVLPLNSYSTGDGSRDFMRVYDIPSYDPNTYWPHFLLTIVVLASSLLSRTPRNLHCFGELCFLFLSWHRPWRLGTSSWVISLVVIFKIPRFGSES